MGTTLKTVSWRFYSELWAETINKLILAHGADDLAEILDMSTQGLKAWSENTWTEGYQYPRMTNLLKVCNMADIDPRIFFETGD